jgi:transposase
MPFLPLHRRFEIIFLNEHPYGPHWSYQEIAAYIGCTKAAVSYWIQRWKVSDDLSNQKKLGRRRSTTKKQDERMVKIAETEHNITSTQIKRKMEALNINVSESTVKRRLREAGGKYAIEISKPLLSESHQEKRLLWARKHQNFDWKHVIFTDESTFQLFRAKKKVWHFGKKKKSTIRLSIRKRFTFGGVFRSSGLVS